MSTPNVELSKRMLEVILLSLLKTSFFKVNVIGPKTSQKVQNKATDVALKINRTFTLNYDRRRILVSRSVQSLVFRNSMLQKE